MKELDKQEKGLDDIPELEEPAEQKSKFKVKLAPKTVKVEAKMNGVTTPKYKEKTPKRERKTSDFEADFPSEESGVGSQSSHSVSPSMYSDDVDGAVTPLASQMKPVYAKKNSLLAHRGRLFAGRQKRRLVEKHGECNVEYTKIKKRKFHMLLDMFTTVIELKWRFIWCLFIASFAVTWTVFGFIWWGIAVGHFDHIETNSSMHFIPCVEGVTDFTTAFLFSLETMHTIGYGTRAMTDECPIAILVLVLQACFGVIVQCIMTGIVLAKIARPKGRGHTIMFSKNAVINKSTKDGKLCLKFRVADMRKSQIVSATIRAILVDKSVSNEGEVMPLNQQNFPIIPETGSDVMLLSWPVTILHYIDEKSPLFDFSAESILFAKFEIIVILEGTIESTGMSIQVRTSYLPSEILWGHRLSPLMSYKKKDGKYMIDHTKFHVTEMLNIPECCARDQNEPMANGCHTCENVDWAGDR